MPRHDRQLGSDAATRLSQYGSDLGPEALAAAADIEAAMCALPPHEMHQEAHTAEVVRLRYGNAAPAVVLNLRSEQPLDDHRALVVCMPIAAVHSEYQRQRLAMLARLFPGRRIVAIANPDGTHQGPRLPGREDRARVAAGDFGPLLDPVMQYLRDTGATVISAVGFSFGAELVSRIPVYASKYKITIRELLAVEPPGVQEYTIGGLALRLGASGWQSRPYIRAAAASPAYYDALRQETAVRHVVHGVASRDSLAATHGIARGGFEEWLDRGLELQPDMVVTIAAGRRSWLSPFDMVQAVAAALRVKHGERVTVVDLGDHGHGLITDAALAHALAWQAIRLDEPEDAAQAS